MSDIGPGLKHHILTQYQPHTRGHGFRTLARIYHIAGGARTLERWYSAWNGTVASLIRKRGGGRPSILSRAEVNTYIGGVIRRANRAHCAIHYRTVWEHVRERTGKKISLSRVKEIGRKILQARRKTTITRTEEECK
jgi:hypothetical protein